VTATRRLAVRRDRLGEWLDRLLGRMRAVDGVVHEDDGESFRLRVALPGFEPGEIEVEIAPDHLVIDASALRAAPLDGIGALGRQANVHLLLPFPESVDCLHAAARLRSGVLTIRAPRSAVGSAR
jgi:HSP20 family molecular chaperone IbpA